MSAVLRTSSLTFRHSEDVPFRLEVSDLEVRKGEIHALIGPNGCGKSTLLRLLAGLLTPQSGSIDLDEKSIAARTKLEMAQRLAFLPQEAGAVSTIRVLDVVLLGRYPWSRGLGLASKDDIRIAEEVMCRMDVGQLKDRIFSTLSGGERQRVLLASVLAQEPLVILLDEPTSSLDIHHQAEVFHLLRAEALRDVAILVVTHDLTLAGHFADRITLMDHGHIVRTGTPTEVLEGKGLAETYGQHVRVIRDPESGHPCVIPSSNLAKDALPVGPIGARATPEGTHHHRSLTLPRFAVLIALFFLIGLVAMTFSPWIGSEKISLFKAAREMATLSQENWSVPAQILALRLPRIGMGFLAGMALGCAGAAMQSLLRNPLVEPYTLGIVSSSALGAVIAISFPSLSFVAGPISGVQIWAFGFALLSLGFLWLSSRRGLLGAGMNGLLLTGITLSLICSSVMMVVRFLANPLTVRAMDQWMVGGVEVASWKDLLPCLPLLLPGLLILLAHARDLNQVEFGDELALGRGVDLRRVQNRVLFGGSLVTAAVVATVGPIGFIGLIVPHIIRRFVGWDQRLLLPCSMLAGGTLLVLADAGARCLSIGGRGAELPVGIVTALVGGPVFLGLLFRQSKPGNPVR